MICPVNQQTNRTTALTPLLRPPSPICTAHVCTYIKCDARCKDTSLLPYNATNSLSKIKTFVAELTLDPKNTSANRRKYYSAADDRVSARKIGCLWMMIIVLVVGSIVSLDVTTLLRELRKGRSGHAPEVPSQRMP